MKQRSLGVDTADSCPVFVPMSVGLQACIEQTVGGLSHGRGASEEPSTMGGPTFDHQKPMVQSGSSGRLSLDHLMPP